MLSRTLNDALPSLQAATASAHTTTRAPRMRASYANRGPAKGSKLRKNLTTHMRLSRAGQPGAADVVRVEVRASRGVCRRVAGGDVGGVEWRAGAAGTAGA